MTKNPSRFAKRMANRLAKAVGRANKHVNKRFADGKGVRDIARDAAATQFRHFTRVLVQSAQAEERVELGPLQTHREHMLLRRQLREQQVNTGF